MTLDFFTRLGSLLETICKTRNVDDADHTFERLPDCLIIDILSRLPSHSFLRCRWVCRHWRALLVSSQDSFTNIHHLSRHTRPMFLIRDDFVKHDFAKHGQDLFVYVCALYFCPNTRQYRILFAEVQGTSCQYFVHILKTWKCKKIHSSTSFKKKKNLLLVKTESWFSEWIKKKDFPFCKRLSEIRIRCAWDLKFLYIQEGELLIHLQADYELYLYNLDRRTVKQLELPRGKMLSYTDCKLYHKSFLAIV
ncbi:hypothetical protein R3W88_028876 [Solanum pinnatisectum]|uniref:F-box domain-containing protein n=1 Tax=Solanum pinnatisectum TaxID=50273 RepID=A0AAV9K3P5_9SOLN|nr:hypothetical protein R3W88_028876 [Solanum pinnatisectum]